MARIRSIKPEIRTSEKVTSWPIEVRYFWILLWGYVNDHGKGIDNAKLIKADAYPLDDGITAKTIEGYLATLARDHVIHRYEAEGKKYLAVVNWEEHQKPSHRSKDVYPNPQEALPQASGESPEGLAPEQGAGSREQGAEEQGAEEQGAESEARDEHSAHFDAFWSAFPSERKSNKPGCRKKFAQAIKRVDPEKIIAAAAAYRDDPNREPQFTVNPHKWLNEERWDSGPLPARNTSNIDQRRAESVQRISQRQPWTPEQQDQAQWGGEDVRALGR